MIYEIQPEWTLHYFDETNIRYFDNIICVISYPQVTYVRSNEINNTHRELMLLVINIEVNFLEALNTMSAAP